MKSLVDIDETFVRGDKISKENWRQFLREKSQVQRFRHPKNMLTNHSYTVAYVDFFDDEVRKNNGDWERVVQEYLYSGIEPIINGFCGGRKFP